MKPIELFILLTLGASTFGLSHPVKADPNAMPSDSAKRWWNIGPAPAFFGPAFNQPGRVPTSGRVADVAVDPTNPDRWLIGAAGGGIWETRDAGATWVPRTDDQPSLNMGALAFAPSEPNIVYAGTGEAAFRADALAGAGLLKSMDGGSTWQLIASSAFARASFSDLKVDPNSAGTVVAATTRGMAGRWSDRLERENIIPNTPAHGIWKSTDGGTNWSLRLAGEATDLETDSGNFQHQYAGLGEPFGHATNGVYRSFDGGENWSSVAGPWGASGGALGRIEMAIAPSDPNVLYVSVVNIVLQDLTGGGTFRGYWKTTNAWSAAPTWSSLPVPAGNEDSFWYHNDLTVDPTNAIVLYFGSFRLYRFDGTVWSVIARASYFEAGGSSLPAVHGDIHAFAWVGNRLIVGDDGGVWSSTNRFGSILNHNTTLSISQVYSGSLHPTDPDFVMLGAQDQSPEIWRGTNGWEIVVNDNDGMVVSISHDKPDTHWAYAAPWFVIYRTRNGGVSFEEAVNGVQYPSSPTPPFAPPLEKSPFTDDIYLAGMDRLWRCANFFSAGIPSWIANSPPRTKMVNGVSYPSWVTSVTFASGDLSGSTYAYAHETGELFLTRNGGATWTNLDPFNVVPNRYVTKLAFDPRDTNVLYVALSGFDEGTPGQPGHLFKTTNAMAADPAWQDISPPVNLPHDCIAMDPSDPASVWVGTDIGVWHSGDGGASWTHHGPELGMPNVPVFDLQINPATGRIVAFTHGRGAFALINTNAVNLRLTQTASQNPAAPDCDLTLVLSVRNQGPVSATGVVLSNSLPADATLVSMSSSQGSCALAGGVVTCELGTLPASYGNATVRLVLRPGSVGQMTNTFAVTANEPDASAANRTATQIIPVSFFTQGPRSFAVRPGAKITNSVAITGCHPLTYQWNFNGSPIPDERNTTLILTNVQLAQEGNYTVTASDGTHTNTSDAGSLTVLIDPVITIVPVSQSVVAGGSATFSVGFTGNPMPFGIEWRQGSTPMASNTVSSLLDFYTLTNAQPSQAGNWRVIVRNLARNIPTGENRTFILTVLLDSDGDGLPDAWELTHGFPTNNAANAALDADGDGLTNWQEYQAGTNPTNASSYLKVDSISLANEGSAVRLRFLAASNNTYTVESRPAADVGAWTRMADVVAASSNRVVEILDPTAPGVSGQRYYRLATPRVP